jgi:P27 family predicted phage terminase small subunit
MKRKPKPPEHLSIEARALWRRTYEVCDMDPPAVLLLNTMCEQFDRMRSAQALIRAEGLIVTEETAAGKVKKRPHPACVIEAAAAAALMKAWKLLGFDQQPPA